MTRGTDIGTARSPRMRLKRELTNSDGTQSLRETNPAVREHEAGDEPSGDASAGRPGQPRGIW